MAVQYFLSHSATSAIERSKMWPSLSAPCKQALPLVNFPTSLNTDTSISHHRKEKVVVVLGATGTGKSRLSIDLATHFFPAEIINSDKIQIYKGLDIVTNKVTEEECKNVPHHLLGVADPDVDFSAVDFRYHASLAVKSITKRDHLPIIAGGSNSYVKALVNDDYEFRSKYECCFIWVDVKPSVLNSYVSSRVNQMVEKGLVDEVRKTFDPKADYNIGIRRAIGVPEMDEYLRSESTLDEETRVKLLELAIGQIKSNTCKLARKQVQNILRLQRQLGLKIHRIDATDVFLRRGDQADEAWEKLVVQPSSQIVSQLYRDDFMPAIRIPPMIRTSAVASVAAATH